MNNDRPIELAALTTAVLAGLFLFVWMFKLTDAVPAEYRSASPGFSWSWDFDYGTALKDAGRVGAAPWPWPARRTGRHIVLPVGQPLRYQGLELTYRGLAGSTHFRLDVVIQNLDAGFTYQREFDTDEARSGFAIADSRYRLEKITPVYLRISRISR